MRYSSELNHAQKVELLRKAYTKGTRIKLYRMKGEDQMPYGLEGTITNVDDIGQIHVNWDNGSSLALCEEDSFSIIN